MQGMGVFQDPITIYDIAEIARIILNLFISTESVDLALAIPYNSIRKWNP